MPIYEYECENKHRFEKWQSIKDDPLTECPACGTAVHKIFHPAGIIFKGSGWYITDSRKPTGDKSDNKSAPKTESTGESKSESKTEVSKSGDSPSAGSSSD